MRKITNDKVSSNIGKKYGLASWRSLEPYSRHLSRLGHCIGELNVLHSAPEDSRAVVLKYLAMCCWLKDGLVKCMHSMYRGLHVRLNRLLRKILSAYECLSRMWMRQ